MQPRLEHALHSGRPLGQHLEGVPVGPFHHATNSLDIVVRHILVKEVAHGVHEDHLRCLPPQRLRQFPRHQSKIEPLLVTHNDKGEIEGVKYDRVAVVLINAVKEQQAQIEQQRSQIELLRMANATLNSRLQAIEKRLRSRGGSSRRRR